MRVHPWPHVQHQHHHLLQHSRKHGQQRAELAAAAQATRGSWQRRWAAAEVTSDLNEHIVLVNTVQLQDADVNRRNAASALKRESTNLSAPSHDGLRISGTR